MPHYKSLSELKCLARTHMFGQYTGAVGAHAIMAMVLSSISIMVESLIPKGSYEALFTSIFYLLYLLLLGIFAAGQAFFYLNIMCGNRVTSNLIFYGFKNNTDKILMIQGYIIALYIAVSLPLGLFTLMYMNTKEPLMYAFIALGAVISVAGIVLVSLIYMPAYYLMYDFPQLTVKEILNMSREKMKGNIGRLFVTYVSFVPLMLLELLTFGIGALWIEPYKNATLTEFFLDIMSPNTTEA